MIKAISLVSGGLDSILATEIVRGLGVDVVAVNFVMPFGCSRSADCCQAQKVDITGDFIKVLRSPAHGYGSNMNPCIDCKILMLKKAKEMMSLAGASFLVTGEVVGQRPMSQMRGMLRHIEKEARVEDLVLRPLSAGLLPETVAEKNGWVDRKKLFSISGRSRKEQLKLALKYGIKDFPQPAGGCLLTDPIYANKIKDLSEHDELTSEDISLLRLGRYFRLAGRARLFVGRNENDNQKLFSVKKEADVFFRSLPDIPGPSALGRGESFADPAILELATRIVARYFSAKDRGKIIKIEVLYNNVNRTVEVVPLIDEEVKKYLI